MRCRTVTSPICPVCGGKKDYSSQFCKLCSESQGNRTNWTAEQVQFLAEHYTEHGAAWVAERLGKTHDRVIWKANRLKIGLSKTATRRIVHDRAAEHMTAHNPSRTEEGRRRIKKRMNSPESQRIKDAFFEGQRRMQKDKPSKLEFRLRAMLSNMGVEFEPSYAVKSKFIVDIKIGNLIIEADGDWWHGHPRFAPLRERQIKQQARDAARNKYLAACGYTVVRIWESDMNEEVVRGILKQHKII